ncbi:MAG: hypothetical protein AAF533_28495 [Acidobacteriota bacterium]
MKLFRSREVREALAHAEAGGQALHVHRILTPTAPPPFRRAVEAGGDLAHLIDHDLERLTATARQLGLPHLVIGRRGRRGQHVDLCGRYLERALAMAEDPA